MWWEESEKCMPQCLCVGDERISTVPCCNLVRNEDNLFKTVDLFETDQYVTLNLKSCLELGFRFGENIAMDTNQDKIGSEVFA